MPSATRNGSSSGAGRWPTRPHEERERLLGPSSSIRVGSRPGASAPTVADAHVNGSGNGGGDFYSQHMMQQQNALASQDKRLDELSAAVRRLHDVSLDINQELTVQQTELDRLENRVDTTNSRLASSIRKIDDVLKKTSDRGKIGTICVLLIILIVILVLLFS